MYIFDNTLTIPEVVKTFDFPQYYRHRADEIRHDGTTSMPIYPFSDKYPISNSQIADIKKYFPSIVRHPLSPQFFWLLNAIDDNGKSVLDTLSPLFLKANKVIRGGLNTYKLSGWMAHVLYVYQIVSHNIPQGIIPSYFSHFDDTSLYTTLFQELKRVYDSLTADMKFLLSIFALTHDIGVVDGVQHHDVDGVKYVEEVLFDLNINDDSLCKAGISISYETLVVLLKVLIGNHALINKISAEESDLSIQERCSEIISYLNLCGVYNKVICNAVPKVFFLLGMADLIAVDDSLFTNRKFKLAYGSYCFMSSVFDGNPIHRDKKEIAILRLSEMVYDNLYSDLSQECDYYLSKLKCNEEVFWNGVFCSYRIEYGATFFKGLRSLELTINVFYSIIVFLYNVVGESKYHHTIISFDANMNMSFFKQAVEEGTFAKCLQRLVSSPNNTCCIDSLTISLNLNELRFFIGQTK